MDNKPLTEKLRPLLLENVVGHIENLKILKTWIEKFKSEEFQFPNMLFYGPPGTGKTSTAKAFAREILGESYPLGLLELNASNERKLEVVRGRIKEFASCAPMVGINLVILDEVENMTADAMAALRRIMEIYNQTTRFILITNEVDSIIEPIQSRCAPFMFGKLDDVVMENYMKTIALSEGIDLQPDTIPILVKHADGKPRDALNVLSKLIGQDGNPITKSVLEKIVLTSSGTAWEAIYTNVFINPLSSDKKIVSLIEERGINPKEIIERILGFLILDEKIPDKIKTTMLIKLAEFDYRLAMRGTPRIQLRCLVWSFCNVGKEYYAKKQE